MDYKARSLKAVIYRTRKGRTSLVWRYYSNVNLCAIEHEISSWREAEIGDHYTVISTEDYLVRAQYTIETQPVPEFRLARKF